MPQKWTGLCGYCEREYVLTKGMRLRKHQADPREFGRESRYHVCPGSNGIPIARRAVAPQRRWTW